MKYFSSMVTILLKFMSKSDLCNFINRHKFQTTRKDPKNAEKKLQGKRVFLRLLPIPAVITINNPAQNNLLSTKKRMYITVHE